MSINEALTFFKSLLSETDNKSEIKVYEGFIGILTSVKNKNLTEDQLQSIEKELDVLALRENPKNRKKHLKQKLTKLQKYLKDEFSFIMEGHHTGMGIALGMTFGMSFGLVFGPMFGMDSGLIYGMMFGMILGLIIGRAKDSEAEKENRVLKTKLK